MSVAKRSLGLLTIAAFLTFTGPAGAQMSSQEKVVLDSLDVARVKDQNRFLSEDVVKTKSGAGAGTAVAGSPEEAELASAVISEMRKIGPKHGHISPEALFLVSGKLRAATNDLKEPIPSE
jgi:hypothetical protein